VIRSNVFSRKFAVSIIASVALMGGSVAAGTIAASPPASASVRHMPSFVHWKYAAKNSCGHGRRGVIIYDSAREHGRGDTESVLACPDGSLWLP
jgi:hypothetical protein